MHFTKLYPRLFLLLALVCFQLAQSEGFFQRARGGITGVFNRLRGKKDPSIPLDPRLAAAKNLIDAAPLSERQEMLSNPHFIAMQEIDQDWQGYHQKQMFSDKTLGATKSTKDYVMEQHYAAFVSGEPKAGIADGRELHRFIRQHSIDRNLISAIGINDASKTGKQDPKSTATAKEKVMKRVRDLEIDRVKKAGDLNGAQNAATLEVSKLIEKYFKHKRNERFAKLLGCFGVTVPFSSPAIDDSVYQHEHACKHDTLKELKKYMSPQDIESLKRMSAFKMRNQKDLINLVATSPGQMDQNEARLVKSDKTPDMHIYGFNATDQERIKAATELAFDMARKAHGALDMHGPDFELFRQYFPGKSIEYVKWVLKNTMERRSKLTFKPLGQQREQAGAAAATRKAEYEPIWLGALDKFESIDDLAATILHEMTHKQRTNIPHIFIANVETVDYDYGEHNCKALKNYPDEPAYNNADSYACFSRNVYKEDDNKVDP